MKTINIISNHISKVFDELHAQLGGTLIIKSKEYILKLNNDSAIGTICGFAVENTITYLEYNLTFKTNISILYHTEDANFLHFAYCSKGELFQNFTEKKKKHKITQFQTGIFANRDEKKSYFYFKKDKEVKASIITLDTSNVNDVELYNHIQSKFFTDPNIHQFAYVGSYNLKIEEKIEELNTMPHSGLARNLLINSIVFLILALEIEQHTNDEANADSLSTSLTKTNLQSIRQITQDIKNNPELNYSLKYLCKKLSMSPHKLQKGFKILHNRTVSDFIKNARVEFAEKLIRTTDLNITEIVYSVGFTSKSYFSKIFKEKYGVNPKEYKKQLHQSTTSA